MTACKTEPCQICGKASLLQSKGRVVSLRSADGRDTRRMSGAFFFLVCFFVSLSSFNVRTTQLKHCHKARLISSRGWLRTSVTSFSSPRWRNLSLTFLHLMLVLDGDREKNKIMPPVFLLRYSLKNKSFRFRQIFSNNRCFLAFCFSADPTWLQPKTDFPLI